MTARAPFTPSPRHPLPLGTLLACAMRDSSETYRCTIRVLSSTRSYVRCEGRSWRWLFLPARPPFVDIDEAAP